MGKAQKKGLVSFQTTQIRDFAADKHRTVDDTPYGGGAGMVMSPEPWGKAIDSVLAARPGHSEHQLGTAVDFTHLSGGTPWSGGDWARTRAGRWMLANAARYGWVLSYPKGATTSTCYRYEPWHWRWVGRTTARAIHESGPVPREGLWRTGSTTPGI